MQAVVTISAPSDFTGLTLDLRYSLLSYLLMDRLPATALLRRVSPVTSAAPDAPPFNAIPRMRAPASAGSCRRLLKPWPAQMLP